MAATTPRWVDPPPVRCCLLIRSDGAGRYSDVDRILRLLNWKVHTAGWRDAVEFLRSHRVPIIISEERPAEGGWEEIFAAVEDHPHPPKLLVPIWMADDKLKAASCRLGTSTLAALCDGRETAHVISSAWLSWLDEWYRGAPAAPKAGEA